MHEGACECICVCADHMPQDCEGQADRWQQHQQREQPHDAIRSPAAARSLCNCCDDCSCLPAAGQTQTDVTQIAATLPRVSSWNNGTVIGSQVPADSRSERQGKDRKPSRGTNRFVGLLHCLPSPVLVSECVFAWVGSVCLSLWLKDDERTSVCVRESVCV